MKKERFYYGSELFTSDLEVVIDKSQNILGYGQIHNIEKFPRVTICGIYDEESKTMSFGVARCSYKDDFVKSVGRDLARKRALESPFKVVTVLSFEKISDVFMKTAYQIESDVMSMGYPITLK